MKAVTVIPGKKKSDKVMDFPDVEVFDDDVSVRVTEVGIDPIDVLVLNGSIGVPPHRRDYLVVGREALGVVEDMGSHVKGLKKGDYVVPTVRRPCNKICVNCLNGQYDMCYTGQYRERGIRGLHGYLRESFLEYPEYLIRIPKEISSVGVLLTPLSIVEKAVEQIVNIQSRAYWEPKNALILGAGLHGIFAAMIARNLDLNTFVYDGIQKTSMNSQVIEKTGAAYVNNKKPVKDIVKDAGKFDIILDTTRNPGYWTQTVEHLSENGVIGLVGVSDLEQVGKLKSMAPHLTGNSIVFSSVSSNPGHYGLAVKHLLDFDYKWPKITSNLISQRVVFNDYRKAFKVSNTDLRTVITI